MFASCFRICFGFENFTVRLRFDERRGELRPQSLRTWKRARVIFYRLCSVFAEFALVSATRNLVIFGLVVQVTPVGLRIKERDPTDIACKPRAQSTILFNREREPVAPFLFHADLLPASGFEELSIH
jgi:hypothetical protein